MYVFFDPESGRIVGSCGAEKDEGLTYVPTGTKALFLDDINCPEVVKDPGSFVIQDLKPVYSPLSVTSEISHEPTELELLQRGLDQIKTEQEMIQTAIDFILMGGV